MKKSKLKAKIAELERSVHIWKAAFQSTSEELSALKAEVTAFAKGRQCGNNVLAAVAGHPSMTVTATREEDAPLAAMATQALRVAEGDMAEKMRELLGPIAVDYMRKVEVPVPGEVAVGGDEATKE